MKPWRRDSREQKCHGHHRRDCWRKCSTHWFYPLRVLAAELAPSHPSPDCIYMLHYLEANFSQYVKVLSVSDDLWSGSERGSAGAVWTFWLKEKLSAHRLWARKCQGTKDDENIWRTQETSWQEWQERLILTWGSRFQYDDWQPTMVHFPCLSLDWTAICVKM